MTKKATSRIIRKRIAQRKANNATKHNAKPNNSIRSQIMNTAAQNMANGIRPFGFTPQQYGNINNERRIEQLRNDAQTRNSNIQNDHVILETLQKQITDLSSESKNMKKLIKDKQSELDKTKHERDMTYDKVHEAERIEHDNERLAEDNRRGQKRLAELKKDNRIIELKKEGEQLREAIHQGELEYIELQKQFEENQKYHENTKQREELDAVIAKNAYYKNILKSDEFQNPDKYHIETMNKLLVEKERLRQQEEIYNLAMENKRQAEALQAQPSNEQLKAITEQFASKRAEIDKRSIELKKQQTEQQDELDMLEYQHQQYMNARKTEQEEQHKLDMLRKEKTYLNAQLEKNNDNTRYQEQINKAANIRVKGLRAAIDVNRKQELLKQKIENDTLEKVGEIINEEPSTEEKNLAKSIGEEKARNELLKERDNLNKTYRASKLKLAEETANNDFHNTPEYQNLEKDNIDLKVETQKNLNKADELKRTAADAKHLRDSRIAYEVSNQLITITPNDIQQVNQHLKEADKIYQNMTAKNQIKSEIQSKSRTFPIKWREFTSSEDYSGVPELLANESTGLDVLQDISNKFNQFLSVSSPPLQPSLPQNPPPQNPPQDNNYVDDDFFYDSI